MKKLSVLVLAALVLALGIFVPAAAEEAAPGLKITVLVDNNALIGKMLLSEPALSMILQDGDKTILFDTGYSDAALKNAHALGFDLTEVDAIALSHGHFDHTVGLFYLMKEMRDRKIDKKIDLICHPDTFLPKDNQGGFFGNVLNEPTLGEYFNITMTKEPYQLTDHLTWLGEIERNYDIEEYVPFTTVFKDGEWVDDYLIEDTAIAYTNDEGVAVITGCSHAGICNITDYAKKVTKQEKVLDVIGGFHLLNPSEERMQGTIDYFLDLGVESIAPCHCVDLPSRMTLNESIPVREVGTGTVIELP
ncbi:MAG: MBL fold metallo-hydrolase [Eubacteriales bacterium]|nr:MBL fold metallo-hydrolase [Clostridiales bacterium]MDY5836370.1 MBL fold metallo-hydrolase [Eubacteriales bacterium]